ncbi:O-succinylhomoserine sulfhydrylase [uncultured Thiothrix sp.]|uniref:O-succinylhomoserine sulfhydrylase n=1 Tax=uncultured Thiothrix sp. TaxID=223185 RepID=UPI0026273E5A|nr:O-succinylhomoserine sulfhydrylase [uncultured Thiothrix sp.]
MYEIDDWEFETLAVRAGHQRTLEGEHAEAIFPTSSFVFASAAEAASRFGGTEPGNIYSRMTNPTVRYFQERLAALEGGESCVATSSGMSAVLAVMLAFLKAGDHLICSNSVFGTTTVLLQNYIQKFGVQVSFVSLTDLSAWEQALQGNTRLLFAETPSNPLTEIVDIGALADLAHRNNSLLVIDNCFCTPALQRPLELGADIIVHSATKYLDGQGRALGGAVVGDAERVGKDVFGVLRSGGVAMSPFNAWIFLKGLETLKIRMQAHCQQALILAQWLSDQPDIERVYYPGLPSHPQHELAKKQQSDFGGVVSFVVKGGQEAAWRVIDNTRMLSITANLGDTRSTITHPATTTHSRLTAEQRAVVGIDDGLIRVSVGLEAVADIQRDLKRGLDN